MVFHSDLTIHFLLITHSWTNIWTTLKHTAMPYSTTNKNNIVVMAKFIYFWQ
ncbi:hypothetical protein L798_11091 [Zootermopsis nevadensis]|uniref:Uncharacterized protein n=1 Tax=Zootermopsis nevadensis TaxID=136037 RepID=A0A067QXE8_ZOONE|nr:hypothetical protein L798_11091 [Zootermopsis nevadensis]